MPKEDLSARREAWENSTVRREMEKIGESEEQFKTRSSIPVKRLYTAEDFSDGDYLSDLGFAGEFPFTRGIHSTMYRARVWTMRQVVGVGLPTETNKRHKFVLSHGQTGLSNDFDLPTLIGYDPDHEMAKGEVCKVGLSISCAEDMDNVFRDIPIEKISTSFNINSTTPFIMAAYIDVARRRNIPLSQLRGTIQNDPLKEYPTQNTYLLPPRPAFRIGCDVIEYCIKNMPRWNPISISEYQFKDTGANTPMSVAFAFANGFAYIEEIMKRGIGIDELAPRLSFLFGVDDDFFEEIAKFRAARKVWASIMKSKYGAKSAESLLLRVHTQTLGSTLTAQQPDVNLIRGTIQALAAVLGGTQSLAISCRDEALSIPSEESQKLSLRIQQVLAFESGVTNTVDPLGGSYYLETLTKHLEEDIYTWMSEIEKNGGPIDCVESGWIEKMIADSAFEYQEQITNKKRIKVGLNEFTEENTSIPFQVFRVDPSTETERIKFIQKFRRERDSALISASLRELKKAAETQENIMPATIEAVANRATIGEVMGALVDVYGAYRKPIVI